MFDMESPYQVKVMGHFAEMAGHISGTRSGYWSLKLIEQGHCSYVIGDNYYNLQPGTVFITHGQGFLKRDPSIQVPHYHVRFRGDWAIHQAQILSRLWDGPVWQTSIFSELLSYWPRTAKVRHSDRPMEMGMQDCALANILTALEEESQGRRHQPPEMDADHLWTYLQRKRQHPTNLNEMAAELQISRATLCRRSRRLLGKPIQQAHEEVRLEYAAELMSDQKRSIAAIARDCGYDDQRYFATRFKRYYGCSASAMRAKL